jgi:hypothetical protein
MTKVQPVIAWQCIHCPTFVVIDLDTCEPTPLDGHENKINDVIQIIKRVPNRFLFGVLKCELLYVVGVSTYDCYTLKIADVAPAFKILDEYFPTDIAELIGTYCTPTNDDIETIVSINDYDDGTLLAHIKCVAAYKRYSSIYGIEKNYSDREPRNFLDVNDFNIAIVPHVRKHMGCDKTMFVKYLDSSNNEKIVST